MFAGGVGELFEQSRLESLQRHERLTCINANQSLSSHIQLEERSVLLKLYEETKGDQWHNRRHWNITENYCCWDGVICNGTTGLVTSLMLRANNLQGELREVPFSRLSKLRVLILSHNRLRGSMENISTSSMREVNLSYNNFTGQIPWTILGRYKSLEHFILAHNKNLGGRIDHLKGLQNLASLSIGHTSVRGRVPSAITRLKKLQILDFEELLLMGNISFIVELPMLSHVYLKNNRLSGRLPEDFGYCLQHLVNLHLDHNLLDGDLPDSFDKVHNITFIKVAFNNFTGMIPSSVLKLEKLQYLDVSFNAFESISSNLTLPSIQFLLLAGNKFATTAKELFTTLTPIIEHQRTSLRVLDVSSCGLIGRVPQMMWKFPKLMVLNISRNEMSGQIPRPPSDIYYLLIADLSHNNFEGDLPNELGRLHSIRKLDVRFNPRLKSLRLPQFAVIDHSNRNREFKHDHFTCPTICLDNAGNGILYMNSAYYNRKYCLCDTGFFGNSGHCRACLPGGKCNGDGKIVILPNYYPLLSPNNTLTLVQCNLYYQGEFRCNPEGNCSCSLSSNMTATCNTSCVCAFHSTGRLCSQCEDNYYRHLDICLPCSKRNEIPGVIVVIVAIILIPTSVFLIPKIPSLNRKVPLLLRVFGFVFQAALVLGLGLTQVIPAYTAEFYVLFVILAVLNHYLAWGSSIRVFSIILFVHIQMLDTLRVSVYWTDCNSCSLARLMHGLHIYKITRVVNFHLSGLACSFPWLVTPIGRLYSILLTPMGFTLLVYICYKIEVHIRKCANRSAQRGIREKIAKLGDNCKSVVVFVLNVFYFPVATDVIKALPWLSGCWRDTKDSDGHMKAYPWISCGSPTNLHLTVLASVALFVYVLGVPLFFIWLLHGERNRVPTDRSDSEADDRLPPGSETTEGSSTRYGTTQHTSATSNREPTAEGSTQQANEGERLLPANETTMEGRADYEHRDFTWLQGLCSSFNYRYTPVVFMFRNLLVALFLSVFTRSEADIQSLLVILVFFASIISVVVAKPYRNKVPVQLENMADVCSFLVILITYNSVSSRRSDVQPGTDIAVFAINSVFVLALCIAVVSQLIYTYTIKTRREQNLDHSTTETSKDNDNQQI